MLSPCRIPLVRAAALLVLLVVAPVGYAQTAGLQCDPCPAPSLSIGVCRVEEPHLKTIPLCGTFNNCFPPEATAAGIDADPLGNDTFQARLLVEVIAYNNVAVGVDFPRLDLFWTAGANAEAPTGDFCDYSVTDHVYTYVFANGLTCEGAPYDLGTYSLAAVVCVVGSPCEERTDVEDLKFIVTKKDLGCPVERTEDCQSCAANRQVGAGKTQVSGPSCVVPPQDGPGATLRYAAGGVGGPNLPGTAGWTPTLGRYWSHDYAQKIVPDPDDTHVWLITERAVFREFGNPVGGLYEVLAPSDEYRTLERTGTGWLLTDLDGTVTEFEEVADGTGRWLSRTDRKGNPLATATYDAVTGRLDEVAFLDERKELFAYYQSPDPAEGKLQSITEVGVEAPPPAPGSTAGRATTWWASTARTRRPGR